MKPPPPNANPIFHHPALHLLDSHPLTPATFHQLHAHLTTLGLSSHTYPLSRLLHHSSSLFPLPFSLFLLHHHSLRYSPSTFLFNTLIASLSTHHRTHQALSLYSHLLHLSSPKPNSHTYPSLLKACGSCPQWAPLGRALHAHVVKFLGAAADRFVLAALLSFYSKSGRLSACRHLFDQIPKRELDLPSWNTMLSALSRGSGDLGNSQCPMEALFLFQRLQLSGIKPNEVTLVAVISACGEVGALSQGVWAHGYVERKKLALNRFVGTALLDCYSKCGRLDLAWQVFDGLPNKDTLCYNTMIRGLAVHGKGSCGVELFDRMRREGVRFDDVTMVVVMCACAHSGMVEEGQRLFDRMEVDFGVKPKMEHYGCLVDLLGRAGKLEEAEEVVCRMSMKPNAVLYRSLLGACRIHENMEIGERVIAQLMQLEPEHGGNYVLLSNMYANVNRWDDVRRVRKAMKDKGIDKTPGSSLVEMDGIIHEFVMGDRTHPDSKKIYAMIEEMGQKLHECGYRARTKEVLFDVEEEDKEDALSYHSERLAIAFALLASDSRDLIRIVKNLRVCVDCHSSTKLVSWIYGREIIMRDRNRFHHFKDGKCSCLDFW